MKERIVTIKDLIAALKKVQIKNGTWPAYITIYADGSSVTGTGYPSTPGADQVFTDATTLEIDTEAGTLSGSVSEIGQWAIEVTKLINADKEY